jgi:hypothetical protein
MTIAIRVDHSKKRIYSYATGDLSFEDIFFHMRHEIGTEAASYPEIFDCTDASMHLDATHIKMLAEYRKTIAESNPPGAVAIVAKPDLYLRVFRMFDGLTKGVRPLEVFSTLSNAESWLDSLESHLPTAA